MSLRKTLTRLMTVACCAAGLSAVVFGQSRTSLQEELRKIFETREYAPEKLPPTKWLEGGHAYTLVEPSASVEGAKDIVRYETASGQRQVLVSASELVVEGAAKPLGIDDYAWSKDMKRVLIYTCSERVWRRKTRCDYWVLDRPSGTLRKLGGAAEPSTLMFAKFSPDATRVAYVYRNNLSTEDLRAGRVTPLTDNGSDTLINGASDWVYEEELGIRDGFRWSPDGKRIAYWSFDSSSVGSFALINNTDSLYPRVKYVPYPKVGTTNSAVRVGVVEAKGGATVWMKVPGDPRDNYIARMEWLDSETLVLQHLNRLQNTNDVLVADALTGELRRVYRDQSNTWVEVFDELEGLDGNRELLWLSEKDGWRHAYRLQREGSGERLVTRFSGDVVRVLGADPSETWLYFIASPDDAMARYLYRAPLDGGAAPVRLTPSGEPGTHSYDLSPDREWAFHTYSRFERPPVTEIIRLPSHERLRVLVDNTELERKAAHLLDPPAEFLKLDIGDVWLDAWLIRPKGFDSERRYPLLVYVYGEPAGQTVLDRWGGDRLLFHHALANEGFVVASVDNRGTPAPRGAAWRKMIYGTIGDLSSKDQAAAVRALAKRTPFIDASRVAVWGWSGGGSNTLNAMFRFPEVFKVGVAVAPVPDQTLYDTIYQERYMGLPSDNARGYRIGSPIHFAEGLKGRLLIIHGTGDDNVHYQGTERLVNRLIELGKPFDLMVYPNRTHAIREGKGTRLHLYSLIARYLLEGRW